MQCDAKKPAIHRDQQENLYDCIFHFLQQLLLIAAHCIYRYNTTVLKLISHETGYALCFSNLPVGFTSKILTQNQAFTTITSSKYHCGRK
jgi:hypothetical protein